MSLKREDRPPGRIVFELVVRAEDYEEDRAGGTLNSKGPDEEFDKRFDAAGKAKKLPKKESRPAPSSNQTRSGKPGSNNVEPASSQGSDPVSGGSATTRAYGPLGQQQPLQNGSGLQFQSTVRTTQASTWRAHAANSSRASFLLLAGSLAFSVRAILIAAWCFAT